MLIDCGSRLEKLAGRGDPGAGLEDGLLKVPAFVLGHRIGINECRLLGRLLIGISPYRRWWYFSLLAK